MANRKQALRGERVTEAVGWEDVEWELFVGAGPDVPNDDLRSQMMHRSLAC